MFPSTQDDQKGTLKDICLYSLQGKIHCPNHICLLAELSYKALAEVTDMISGQ